MNDVTGSSLGKEVTYSDRYDPSFLYPIPRAQNRLTLGIENVLPFVGEDLWTSYELSWLDQKGKPQVAIAEFFIPIDSTNIVESKSFKLYLNSFNQTRFESWDEVRNNLEADLSEAAEATVRVTLFPCQDYHRESNTNDSQRVDQVVTIDDLEADEYVYSPDKSILNCKPEGNANETLHSALLRSNCPVTGQPDWADLYVRYEGPEIDRISLLKYVVSFRQCQDFHEHCVERIFSDILEVCKPTSLAVYARYTRRGGLDINPYRATQNLSNQPPLIRMPRQ